MCDRREYAWQHNADAALLVDPSTRQKTCRAAD
jgi:hypothetical protein